MEGLTALFIHSANRGYRQTESRLPVGERSTRSMSLRFLLVVLLVLVLDWVGCLRGRGRARGGLGSWSQCTAARPRGLSMNRRVLPASCRQTHRSKALPARCRQHLGGAVSPVGGSLPQCMRESEKGSPELHARRTGQRLASSPLQLHPIQWRCSDCGRETRRTTSRLFDAARFARVRRRSPASH